ncbi:hypothetical protein E2542_SST07083 [Spatholobus suberectus]|nr:hypothetical protein E2542_SST07083 [Spatholobus suberectus]
MHFDGFNPKPSGLQFSEPPDVGNWFSSYEYRSPDPDSNFSVEDSAFGEKRYMKDDDEEEKEEKVSVRGEGVVGEKLVQCNRTCVKEDNHNEVLCLNKSLQTSETGSRATFMSHPSLIQVAFSEMKFLKRMGVGKRGLILKS